MLGAGRIAPMMIYDSRLTMADLRLGRPFRAGDRVRSWFPGRCRGLGLDRAFGAGNSSRHSGRRRSQSRRYSNGRRRWAHAGFRAGCPKRPAGSRCHPGKAVAVVRVELKCGGDSTNRAVQPQPRATSWETGSTVRPSPEKGGPVVCPVLACLHIHLIFSTKNARQRLPRAALRAHPSDILPETKRNPSVSPKCIV